MSGDGNGDAWRMLREGRRQLSSRKERMRQLRHPLHERATVRARDMGSRGCGGRGSEAYCLVWD